MRGVIFRLEFWMEIRLSLDHLQNVFISNEMERHIKRNIASAI